MNDEEKIILEDNEDVFEPVESGSSLTILSFSIGNENFCININEAKEIIIPKLITKVPNTPDYVLGVINLRGEIIGLVDIGTFLGVAETNVTSDSKGLVVEIEDIKVAIIFNKMNEVIRVKEEDIQPPLSTIRGELAEYTLGAIEIGEKIYTLLNLKKIILSDSFKKNGR